VQLNELSPDQGSSETIPLPNRSGNRKPQIPFPIVSTGRGDASSSLQINHKGMDGSLVAAGIQTQGAHQVGAGLGTFLDQLGADRGADDGADHGSVRLIEL
jgi:hypothetical protein